MQTVYDWISLAVFAGLIVLFLHRSMQDVAPDKIWQYAPPAIGCAVANYLGNEGWGLIAVAILVAAAAYIYYVLKPGMIR
jgi:divalent metal cation (Fe/Co/Zn/Cd) transporter